MPDRLSRPAGPRRRAGPATPAAAGRAVPARPAARRPAGRTGGGPGATTRIPAPRPRRRVTGRAVVLSVVLLALVLSYIFPVRVYLAQQAEIAQLRADQREQRARIDRLAAEAALWSDDEYIRIQARKRLYFGEPGEMLLLPVSADDQLVTDPGAPPEGEPVSPPPWWDSLWASLRSADTLPGGQPAGDAGTAGPAAGTAGAESGTTGPDAGTGPG